MSQNIINFLIQIGALFLCGAGGVFLKMWYDHNKVKNKLDINEKLDEISIKNLQKNIDDVKGASRLQEENFEKILIRFQKEFSSSLNSSIELVIAKLKLEINEIVKDLATKEELRGVNEDIRALYRKADENYERISDAYSKIQGNEIKIDNIKDHSQL